MKLTYYNPAGNSIEFSSASETYRLLIGMRGFHESPEAFHQTTQAPYQSGATRAITLYEPREIAFNVVVMAPDYEALEQAGQYLGLVLNPLLGPGTLVYTRQDGTEYSLTCIGEGKCPGDPTEESPTNYKVQIRMVAYDPFWYSYPITRTDFGAGTPLAYPYAYPFAYPATSATHTLTNSGNVASPATIVITGEIENPKITRTYTDKYGTVVSEDLSFTLTMTAGEVLTITTGPTNPTITLLHDTGSYDANPWQYLDADPDFWQLQPGDNTVTLTDVSIDAATIMSVYHASCYTAV